MALLDFSGITWVSWHQKGKARKVKPIWIYWSKSGSGISWAICKSAPWPRHITTPASHHSIFYRSDALPATQPTASKHWRHATQSTSLVSVVSQRSLVSGRGPWKWRSVPPYGLMWVGKDFAFTFFTCENCCDLSWLYQLFVNSLWLGVPLPGAVPQAEKHKEFKVRQSCVSSQEWRRSVYTEHGSTSCRVFFAACCKYDIIRFICNCWNHFCLALKLYCMLSYDWKHLAECIPLPGKHRSIH